MTGVPGDRWSSLFADLEARLDAAERAELEGDVADRTRSALGGVALTDRLRAAADAAAPLVLRVRGAGAVRGRVSDAGPDWLLLDEEGGAEVLVPVTALLAVTGLGAAARPGGRVDRRFDLRWAVRGLARDRAPVTVVLEDGTALAGTVDAAGADALDLAVHPPGELRRRGAVREVAAVPWAGLALVRRAR